MERTNQAGSTGLPKSLENPNGSSARSQNQNGGVQLRTSRKIVNTSRPFLLLDVRDADEFNIGHIVTG